MDDKLNFKYDPEEVTDLRDVQFEPDPEPAPPPDEPPSAKNLWLSFKPRDLSIRQMLVIIAIALAVLGIFYFFMVWADQPGDKFPNLPPVLPRRAAFAPGPALPRNFTPNQVICQ